jgi:hypothetical protein
MNLFLHRNSDFLINAVSYVQRRFCGTHTVSTEITPPYKAFREIHCLKFSKCVLQFCLNYGDIKSSYFQENKELLLCWINGQSIHHFQQRSSHFLRPLKNMCSSHCILSKSYFHTKKILYHFSPV